MQEMCIQYLCWEYPLKKEIVDHCSILAWETPRTEEPSRIQSMGSQRVRHDLATEHNKIQTYGQLNK